MAGSDGDGDGDGDGECDDGDGVTDTVGKVDNGGVGGNPGVEQLLQQLAGFLTALWL